jgi:hypothetical protein
MHGAVIITAGEQRPEFQLAVVRLVTVSGAQVIFDDGRVFPVHHKTALFQPQVLDLIDKYRMRIETELAEVVKSLRI